MEVLKTTPKRDRQPDEEIKDAAELQRLGLYDHHKRYTVNRRPPEGEPEIYLFGDGEMLIDLDGGKVFLSRADVVALYTFLDQPHVKKMMLPVLRASLIESGNSELIEALTTMSHDHLQAILWAYGRAEKPAFLDAPQAA